MLVPPVGNPMCAACEEYEEVPETVPLDFSEENITGVASKISGADGALGAEAIDLRNFLLRFGCASEEFRFVIAGLADWMDNSSPPPVLITVIGWHVASLHWISVCGCAP